MAAKLGIGCRRDCDGDVIPPVKRNNELGNTGLDSSPNVCSKNHDFLF